MPRIRSIKPDFWKSEDIAALTMQTRLTFIGLWSYVDDNGVGRDNVQLIAAEIYPLEPDPIDTLAMVHRGLDELSRASRVTRYTNDGRGFIHITNWTRHQKIDRPNKARYPLPTDPGSEPLTCENLNSIGTPDESHRDTREGPVLGVGAGSSGRGVGAEEQGAEESDATPAPDERPDILHVCQLLAKHIESNGSKPPTITEKWKTEARRLIDLDKHTVDDIERAIRWSQNDPFYKSVILSMPKLRQHYDAMRLKAQADGRHPTTPSSDVLDRAQAQLDARRIP